MSAPYTAIRSAFTTKLLAFPTLPQVAWENRPFTPTQVPYLQPTLIPAESFQSEIGVNGMNRYSGIYQISIFVPAGQGTAAIDLLRDTLIDHFCRGTIITCDDVPEWDTDIFWSNNRDARVTILKSWTGPTMFETDWVHVPVSVSYRLDATN